MVVTTGTAGAIAELEVSADLLLRGYQVFRALSPSCPCDLGILYEGRFLRVEVKTCRAVAKGARIVVGATPSKFDLFAGLLIGETGRRVTYSDPAGEAFGQLPYLVQVVIRPVGFTKTKVVCENCGKTFHPNKAGQKFCPFNKCKRE